MHKRCCLLFTLIIFVVLIIGGCDSSRNNSQTKQDSGSSTSRQEVFVDYNVELNKINPQQAWEIFKKEYGLPGEMKAGGAGITWKKGIAQYVLGFRSKQYSGTQQEIATFFLQEHGNLIKLQNNSLYFVDMYKSGEENRIIYEQRYQNIPVFGTTVQVLVTSDWRVRQLSADYYPEIEIYQSNKLTADSSKFKNAIHDFLIKKGFKEGQELDNIMESRRPEKFIYPVKKDSSTIFYSVLLYRLPGARLFLDSTTAEIIEIEDFYSE